MKILNVILFKNDNEIHECSNAIFEEKLSRSSFLPNRNFAEYGERYSLIARSV